MSDPYVVANGVPKLSPKFQNEILKTVENNEIDVHTIFDKESLNRTMKDLGEPQ